MTLLAARTAGIPRLQELTFLEETAKAVSDGCTFNRIRQILIDHMASLREHDTPTGNTAVFRMAKHDPYRYGNNASDALAELMRLGMVEKKVLPSKRTTIEAYANQKYVLTPKGEAWVARLKNSRTAAYDELLQALWAAHHQFAGYLRALARGMLVVPTANWTEVHSTPVGDEGRGAYVAFLAARAAGAVHQGVTGWNATEDEIRAAITDYVRAKVEAATRRQRPNPLPRNRDFIGACEEALVSFAFERAGMQLDYISHEILRRWTKNLGVANFSYHVPGPPALRLWATAELDEEDGVPRVRRRSVTEWGTRVIDELPDAYERVRRQTPGNSWVPIYRVRAAVCSKLGLNDPIFDAAIRQYLAKELRPDAPFRLNFDAAEIGSTPPTEQPLRLTGSNGRTNTLRAMALTPESERSLA